MNVAIISQPEAVDILEVKYIMKRKKTSGSNKRE